MGDVGSAFLGFVFGILPLVSVLYELPEKCESGRNSAIARNGSFGGLAIRR